MANSIPDLRRLPVTVGDTIFVFDSYCSHREGVVTEVDVENRKVRFIHMKTGRPNTARSNTIVKVAPRA